VRQIFTSLGPIHLSRELSLQGPWSRHAAPTCLVQATEDHTDRRPRWLRRLPRFTAFSFWAIVLATPTDSLNEQKQALRRAASDRRAAAHADRAEEAGPALADRFCAAFDDRLEGAVVSLFSPMRDEIDVGVLFETLTDHGARTALPVMDGPDAPLVFRAWSPGDALIDAAFGVREPADDASVLQPGIVGVPLLAFDRIGNRLGYGGGYYDRTLRALRAAHDIIAVGICYDEQEMPNIPVHQRDERLDMIITDRRTIRP
jgi:5-formyltetrahydrofolate cyclo-ligase